MQDRLIALARLPAGRAQCSPCFFALANDGFVRSRLERVHARRIIEVEKSCNRYPTLKFQK